MTTKLLNNAQAESPTLVPLQILHNAQLTIIYCPNNLEHSTLSSPDLSALMNDDTAFRLEFIGNSSMIAVIYFQYVPECNIHQEC